MATGLMALVDDCIKERWQTPKVHRIPVPLTSKTLSFENINPQALIQNIKPKAFIQNLFQRRHSNETAQPPAISSSPLPAISAY